MELNQFVNEFLDEFEIVCDQWQKKKKGMNHHDARRLVRTAVINVLMGTRGADEAGNRPLGKPRKTAITEK